MSAALLPFIGWTFLPNLVTGWVQSLYYGIAIRAGDPKPQPGSPRYVKHRRRILITVIIAYLLYTLYEADYQMRRQGDFYEALGVAHDVDDRGIKSRFRRLAALHHPDKVTASEDRAASEAFFVHLKLAQDTLLNPTKRFAYDRLGPDMLEFQHCSSIRDYLFMGVRTSAPMYLGSAFFMIILGVTGYLQWGRFWRYLFSATLLLLEFYTLTRPYYPPLLTRLLNPIISTLQTLHLTTHGPLLPFQLTHLARKATLTLFIALSQLGPLFQPPSPTPTASSSNPNAVDPAQLQRLEAIALSNDAEATRLLALDMAPFVGDEKGVREVQSRIKEWLVQNTIRADPEVRDAMGRVMGRRREGAPAGARAVG